MNLRYWKSRQKNGYHQNNEYINTIILFEELTRLGATQEMIVDSFFEVINNWPSARGLRSLHIKMFLTYIFEEKMTLKRVLYQYEIKIRTEYLRQIFKKVERKIWKYYGYGNVRREVYFNILDKIEHQPPE